MPSVLSDSSVEHRDSTKASSSSGVSSDCSDSDHEIDDLTGKFKSRSDVYDYHIEVSTQTEVSIEEQQKSMELTHLNLEIEKLTKFKLDSIEASRKSPDHMALEELDDLRVSYNYFPH